MKTELIEKAYAIARERYAEIGVDTEKALAALQNISLSLHCWQADDVTGFENRGGDLTGGIQATGNYPGKARNIGELSLAAKASYHLMLAWNAFAALVFITMRNIIPTFFSTNPEVIAIASQLLVFAALYQLSDGIQNVSVGILRGIQDVKIIMPIAFVSYWLLNLPVGYLFGFTLGMGPTGLFLGFSFGLSAAAVMMIVRIRRSVRKLRLGN